MHLTVSYNSESDLDPFAERANGESLKSLWRVRSAHEFHAARRPGIGAHRRLDLDKGIAPSMWFCTVLAFALDAVVGSTNAA